MGKEGRKRKRSVYHVEDDQLQRLLRERCRPEYTAWVRFL